MVYHELSPHPALRPYVDCLWLRSGPQLGAQPWILPDGCIDLLVSDERAFVVGAMTRTLVIGERSTPPVVTVGVRFRPGGAAPFLRTSAHELTDRQVDCSQLGTAWRALDRLADERRPRARIAALERTLLAQLGRVSPPHALVAHAAPALSARNAPSVAELARQLGCSRQHLGRAFREQVGVGPKELSKIARLHRALAHAQRARPRLAELAAYAGYCDEAHMDCDFRQLVGSTPRRALASGSIRPILSLFGAP